MLQRANWKETFGRVKEYGSAFFFLTMCMAFLPLSVDKR